MTKTARQLSVSNEVLKVSSVEHLGKARAYPFLKWAGG